MKRGPKPTPVADRLFARLVEDPSTGCLNWTGSTGAKGYGRIGVTRESRLLVHRVAFELAKGPIPAGMVIDHLCRNPPCCNPDHLEAVTTAENTRRGNSGRKDAMKTHCPQGHPYDSGNTGLTEKGHRYCRQCKRDKGLARRKAAREPNTSSPTPVSMEEIEEALKPVDAMFEEYMRDESADHIKINSLIEIAGPKAQAILSRLHGIKKEEGE